MSQLKSGLTLADGEQLVMEIEAELYASSQNPVFQFIGTLKRIWDKICGNKKRSFLVITNKRAIAVWEQIYCYCIPAHRYINTIMPANILEVGYERHTICGCCPAIYLYLNCHINNRQFFLKSGSEADAQKIASAIYSAIASAQG